MRDYGMRMVAVLWAFISLLTFVIACGNAVPPKAPVAPSAPDPGSPTSSSPPQAKPSAPFSPTNAPTVTSLKTMSPQPPATQLPYDVAENILPVIELAKLTTTGANYTSLGRDAQSNLHVISWRSGLVEDRVRAADGNWRPVTEIKKDSQIAPQALQVLATPDRQICVVWLIALENPGEACYANGVWVERKGINLDAKQGPIMSFRAAFDPQGQLAAIKDVAFKGLFLGDQRLLDQQGSQYRFVIDAQGGYHLVYLQTTTALLYRYSKNQGNDWSAPVELGRIYPRALVEDWDFEADRRGNVHLIWPNTDSMPVYRMWTPSGGWRPSETLMDWLGLFQRGIALQGVGQFSRFDLSTDGDGISYAAAEGQMNVILMTKATGKWQLRIIAKSPGPDWIGRPNLLAGNGGKVDLVWQSLKALYYAQTP